MKFFWHKKKGLNLHIKRVNHVLGKSDSELSTSSYFLQKLFDFRQRIIWAAKQTLHITSKVKILYWSQITPQQLSKAEDDKEISLILGNKM